jgi:hypothetical protein
MAGGNTRTTDTAGAATDDKKVEVHHGLYFSFQRAE